MLDPRVDPFIGAVFIVIILILLVGIIGRVADDDADLAVILALDPAHIFVADRPIKVIHMTCILPKRRDIIKRIDKAEIGIFSELPGDRRVSRLDIQIGDIVRQDRHLIGVKLLLIFVPQLFVISPKMFEQLNDERASARRRIKDFNAAIHQLFAEMGLAQPIGAADHEADNLSRRINHAQPIRRHRVINLVEILIQPFEKALFLTVAINHGGGGLDRGIIWPKLFEQLLLFAVAEQFILKRDQRHRDIILAVEIGVFKHFGKDILSQDMLDQHFLHIAFGDRRIDRITRMFQEIILRLGERFGRGALVRDDPAQRLKHSRQIDRELLHRLVKFGNLSTFMREKAREEGEERFSILH